jgi:predicted negative regulator of RcsB-dependent stress response
MQEIIVAFVVFAAASYVGWQVWQTLFSQPKTSCGSACQTCPAGNTKADNHLPLVTLDVQVKQTSME